MCEGSTCAFQVVELSGDAVRQLFTPDLGRAEQQDGVAFSNSLIAQTHYVVIIPLYTHTS